jgi:gamma-glutamyltranspeptidase/glutathione hydrolase
MKRASGLTTRAALFRGLALAIACSAAAPLVAPPAAQADAARADASPSGAVGAERGMVVASQSDAARAGAAIFARGGNAIDAAVATAMALSVTQPFSAGLGGGFFALVRTAEGELVALDARETAPAAADRDMYVRPGVAEDASVLGPLAVATPGFALGLAQLQKGYGTLPWAEVLAPAIDLAERGFETGFYHAELLRGLRARGFEKRFPETARIHFPPPDEPIRPGRRVVQADLARTLRLVAEQGAEAATKGEIAAKIADEMKRRGGLVTREDLAAYRTVRREPVRGSYRGVEVVSFPPPSSGGAVLVEALNVLEGFDLAKLAPGSADESHLVVEALKLAFADRAAWLGDPDFVEVPVARLTSKEYAAGLRERIRPGGPAIEVRGSGIPPHDAGTTHLSTADAAGNAVALTMTINTPFGSGITVAGTGIVLNNEMDDFARAPDVPNVYGLVDTRGANAIAPGKRPLSSMTPTLLLRGKRPFMVTGSPGGPRIISTTLLTILAVVDHGQGARAAVSAARYHHQWLPDRVSVEPGVPESVAKALRGRGHEVERAKTAWSSAQAIVIDPKTGRLEGGSDPRGDGLAAGY